MDVQLTAGLTLLLVGLSLGDNPWSWTNPRVLATLIAGIVLLVVFGVYEWRCKSRSLGFTPMTHTNSYRTVTKIGILHHDLFSNGAARTFGLCIGLIFIEGIMLFTIIVFYPAL